jgi:hypothetical protein
MIKSTGKLFYVVDGESEALTVEPIEDGDYAEWTEMVNDNGVLWYVSDDDMNLTYEEFWGKPQK